jgi:CelD/BcsL family acetyltransferase involved in cellulose biosynthesis
MPALEIAHELEAVREEWQALGERSGNVFATWEWAEAWWRHFGAGEPFLALARGEDGEPAALVAVELRRRGPLRVARFVGHGPSDELGPISASGDRRGAEALLELHSGSERRWDVLLAERMPPGAGAERLGGRTLLREASPIVEGPEGGFEGFLASRSRNFRSQVRRKERKLRERGLSFRLGDDPDRIEADMRTLGELHEERWGAEGSGALRDRRAAFHLDFARAALERGWLRLWLAEVDGKAVAAWYGFRFGGAEWYYQSGRHPDWDKDSVGLVLLAHTIREAFDDGLRTYRLLRGGESYKDRFATSDPGLETVVAGRGALGAAAERSAGAALRLRRALRRGSGGAPSTTPRPSG